MTYLVHIMLDDGTKQTYSVDRDMALSLTNDMKQSGAGIIRTSNDQGELIWVNLNKAAAVNIQKMRR